MDGLIAAPTVETTVIDLDIFFTYGPPLQATLHEGDSYQENEKTGRLVISIGREITKVMLDKVVWYSARTRTLKTPAKPPANASGM